MFIYTHRHLPICMYIYKWVFIYKNLYICICLCVSETDTLTSAVWDGRASSPGGSGAFRTTGGISYQLPNPCIQLSAHHTEESTLVPKEEAGGRWVPPPSAVVGVREVLVLLSVN